MLAVRTSRTAPACCCSLPRGVTPLQRLQRTRVERRLAESPPPDLRPSWPVRALALSWALGAAITAVALFMTPQQHAAAPDKPFAGPERPSTPGSPRLVEQHLDIEPPAYTGLPARSEDTLDAKLPAGARLRWRLRFEPQPTSVQLVFHDQSRVTLVVADGAWTAERAIDRSTLYRIVLDGEAVVDGETTSPPRRDRGPAAFDPRRRAGAERDDARDRPVDSGHCSSRRVTITAWGRRACTSRWRKGAARTSP